MRTLAVLLVVAILSVHADLVMHNPRGSNNRLDESNRDRANANRLFDSQNNNKGGYNVNTMNYYGGSVLPITWTSQHACGLPDYGNCMLIFQYMCDSNVYTSIRDGQSTTRIDPTKPNDFSKGRHEPVDFFNACQTRKRNGGLFTADRTLNGATAIYTRQNTDGERFGLECPEERDYYPYWHYSPWVDIAVITSNATMCPWYQENSQNVMPKSVCAGQKAPDPNNPTLVLTGAFYNNENECKTAGFLWTTTPAWNLPAPDCVDANKLYRARVNHQGNGFDAQPQTYVWNLPVLPVAAVCVVRMRYNISTNDYDAWNTFSDQNGAKSPVKNDATYDLNTGSIATGAAGIKLKLSMNTDQFGRTFQDRSSVFSVLPPPVKGRILNLNVVGQRGNIVENYPSWEYDFVPRHMHATTSDYIHRQVTGSNTTPDGDGQGGDGLDRSNFVQIPTISPLTGVSGMGSNYPDYLTNITQTSGGWATALQWALQGGKSSKLDDVNPHQDYGLMRYSNAVTINYISTRNNNFSNRSQKGQIVVTNNKTKKKANIALIAGVAAGGVVALGAIGVAVWAFMAGKLGKQPIGTNPPSNYFAEMSGPITQ